MFVCLTGIDFVVASFYTNKREERGTVQSGVTSVPHISTSTYNAISTIESRSNHWL